MRLSRLSIGLAALRSPSDTWAGVIFYLACGVLALGVVGALCAGAAERAWWLGFAVFGWGLTPTLASVVFRSDFPRLRAFLEKVDACHSSLRSE